MADAAPEALLAVTAAAVVVLVAWFMPWHMDDYPKTVKRDYGHSTTARAFCYR